VYKIDSGIIRRDRQLIMVVIDMLLSEKLFRRRGYNRNHPSLGKEK
jgi:hypothetical protein